MDIIKTSREIGLFEAARNMSEAYESPAVRSKVEESMPMPRAAITPRITQAADYLLHFNKRKLLLLSPEIALIEELAQKAQSGIQVIVAIPCDMDLESRVRLYNNIPAGISVQLLEEPYFPDAFTPANGMIVSFGYLAGERLMALPECYRMTDHYGGFWGRKVFIPYVVREDSARFSYWMEVNPSKFSDIWRGEV